jgi:hypothetical protein
LRSIAGDGSNAAAGVHQWMDARRLTERLASEMAAFLMNRAHS